MNTLYNNGVTRGGTESTVSEERSTLITIFLTRQTVHEGRRLDDGRILACLSLFLWVHYWQWCVLPAEVYLKS